MESLLNCNHNIIMIHILTLLGVNNVNRDGQGRPKTATIYDSLRQRISSQSTKYDIALAFRASAYHTSHQTPMVGRRAYDQMIEGGVLEDKAKEYTLLILGAFTKIKKKVKEEEEEKKKKEKKGGKTKDPFKMEAIKVQQVELDAVDSLVNKIIDGYVPVPEDYKFLKVNESVDIALFGRMLAANPEFDVDAAVSVNHAVTVNDIGHVEEDYFIATDSLQGAETKGSAHMDKFHFSSGVFYSYISIDRDLLMANLGGNKELADQAINDFIQIVATTSKGANKNRCADGVALPSYIMLEKGKFAPRTLFSAFRKPIGGVDVLENAIAELKLTKASFDKCFYAFDSIELNQLESKGSLSELIKFSTDEG